MPNPRDENALLAIEIMTAWASDPDLETDFLLKQLRANGLADGEEEHPIVQLLSGFVNLTGLLLIRGSARWASRRRRRCGRWR